MRPTAQLSLVSLALALVLTAPRAHADAAPGPCDTKNAGDTCTTYAGEAGTCQTVNGYLDCVATPPTTSSSSSTSGAGGGTGTGGGGSGGDGDQDDDSGCSFAAPTPAAGAGLGLVLGLGALLVDRRWRRRRA